MNLYARFENLCRAVLEAHGYEIEKAYEGSGRDFGVDFVMRTQTGERMVVEAKLYRSLRIPRSVLENAFYRLQVMKKELKAPKALLITTLLTPPTEASLHTHGIEVWTIDELVRNASVSLGLQGALSDFLRDAEIGSVGTEGPPREVADAIAAGAIPPSPDLGGQLISELETIKRGRGHWLLFEHWCGRAIKYLFGDQFGATASQRAMEGGFHRTDLIARIVPTHSFWQALVSDCRSRYAVFEFKNYVGKIAQDQVFTTEKYLYTPALRSVAIIICRSGISKSAVRAVKAILRESGKLILLLDIKDLIGMLQAQDRGDDPNNRLIEIFDETLIDTAP